MILRNQRSLKADDMISFLSEGRFPAAGGAVVFVFPYLLHSTDSEITGDDLQDANVTLNQERGNPEVAFSPESSRCRLYFGKVTKAERRPCDGDRS